MKKLTLYILLALVLSSCSQAGSGGIEVKDAWVRAASDTTGGVFMNISNIGAEADRLVSAESNAAEIVQLHETTVENEVMMMHEVDGIDIPARSVVELAPGGYHVMLINLKQPLKPGDEVVLTLNFEKAGPVSVEAEVRAP
jgi:copper(I)-binding protein